jgi:O-antigen ligase
MYKKLLYFFILSLSLSPKIAHLFAGAALIAWLFERDKNWRNLLTPLALLPIGWWIWHVVCNFLIHQTGQHGVTDITLNISFLLFPLAFFTTTFSETDFIKLIRGFINGIFLAALYCFVLSVYAYYNSGDINVLFYESLVAPLDFHPTYFGWYLSFALFINLFFIKQDWQKADTIQKTLAVITQVFYFIFLLLLGSRIAILAVFITAACWFLYEMQQKGKILLASISIIASGGVSLLLISQINFLKWRFAAIFPFLVPNSSVKILHIDPRTALFKTVLEVIKANPILGIGISASKTLIENTQTSAHIILNNTHNQFLQTQLTTGIIGSFLLLSFLFFILKKALKTPKSSLITFIIPIFCLLFVLCSMTEALLERERGILFFVFFYCLLAAKNDAETNAKMT